MSNITFPTKNKSLTSVHSQQISSNQVMEKPREKVFYRKVSFAESQTTMTDGRKERQRPRSRSVYTNKSHNSDTSGSIRDVLKYDSVAPWIARSLSNKNLYMDDYHHDYYHDEGGHGGGNTMPPLSMGPHPHAHSHHHHMSQQQQQYQHGASITSQGNVVLRLQDRVRVEISLEKAVRVVNMRSGIVLALSATGSSAALIHPNGRVYQYGSRVEILANDSQGNNKYAKMWYKGVSFTSDQCALVYLVDSAGTRTTTDTFSDLSGDFSVSVFYNDGPYSEPHHIVSSQALFNEAVAVLQTSNHWVSEDGTNNWLINSVRVSQTLDGLVRVGRSSNKFSLRTSPSNGSASVSSPFLHCTGSMGQTRHLFVRRGERRMHYDGASFIVRNAGHSAGFDDKHQLKVY